MISADSLLTMVAVYPIQYWNCYLPSEVWFGVSIGVGKDSRIHARYLGYSQGYH